MYTNGSSLSEVGKRLPLLYFKSPDGSIATPVRRLLEFSISLLITICVYVYLDGLFKAPIMRSGMSLTFFIIGLYSSYIFISGFSRFGFSFRCITGLYFFLFYFVAAFSICRTERWSLVPLQIHESGIGMRLNLLILVALACWHTAYATSRKFKLDGRLLARLTNIGSPYVSGGPLVGAFVVAGFAISLVGLRTFLFRSATNEATDLDSWQMLIVYLGAKSMALAVLGYYLISFMRISKGYVFTMLTFAVLLNAVINSPLGSARFFSFLVFSGLFGILVQRLRYRLVFIPAALLVAVLLSNIIGSIRHSKNLDDVRDSLGTAFQQSDTSDFLFTGAFDAYEVFGHGILYADERGVTFGRQLAGAVLFWVPRVMWPNKPDGTGRMLGENYIAGAGSTLNVNLSAPLPLEGYINFGLIGCGFFCAGFGFLCGKADYYLEYKRHANSWGIWDFMLFTLVGWSLFLWRGDLMNAMSFMSALLVSFFLVASLTVFSPRTK